MLACVFFSEVLSRLVGLSLHFEYVSSAKAHENALDIPQTC
jgi:hypothetical protein